MSSRMWRIRRKLFGLARTPIKMSRDLVREISFGVRSKYCPSGGFCLRQNRAARKKYRFTTFLSRTALGVGAGAFFVLCGLIHATHGSGVAQDDHSRPNILLIISDDQRFDSMGEFMPMTQARIFDQGINFSKAYITTPSCCPSRSSIFTGLYASHHGVRTNSKPLRHTTFMQHLHAAGYYTGMIGKYLNSWSGSPRPEFNFWSVFPGGSSAYVNPRMNVNGEWRNRSGYMTDLLRDDALRFFDKAKAQKGPFVLVFAPNAPHFPTVPDRHDKVAYQELPPYRPLNYNIRITDGEPRWKTKRPLLTPFRRRNVDKFRLNQLRTLLALDRAVNAMLDALQKSGQIDNTVIIYLSDNGIMWGELGLISKDCVYEPAIHVPFAIRYPPLVANGQVREELIANIDIAPTVLQLAGLEVPAGLDGRSLVPLFGTQNIPWREYLLIESWRDTVDREPFIALHGKRYVYVENKRSGVELYDLETDPGQTRNLAYEAGYAGLRSELQAKLVALR